jgi:hypothetical protein
MNPVVDRTTRTKHRRQQQTTPKTQKGFDWRAYFQHHW